MTEDQALTALTAAPAKMMHLTAGSARSPRQGRGLRVLSGAPFSVYTQVLETYIDGVKVFDRGNPRDAAYQVGGFALAEPGRAPKVGPPVPPTLPLRAPPAPQQEGAAKSGLVIVLAARVYPVSGRRSATAWSWSRTARSSRQARATRTLKSPPARRC